VLPVERSDGREKLGLARSGVPSGDAGGLVCPARRSVGDDGLALGREKLGLRPSVAPSAVGCVSESGRRSGCDDGGKSSESRVGCLKEDVAPPDVASAAGDVL
jgi:hypothetical protein